MHRRGTIGAAPPQGSKAAKQQSSKAIYVCTFITELTLQVSICRMLLQQGEGQVVVSCKLQTAKPLLDVTKAKASQGIIPIGQICLGLLAPTLQAPKAAAAPAAQSHGWIIVQPAVHSNHMHIRHSHKQTETDRQTDRPRREEAPSLPLSMLQSFSHYIKFTLRLPFLLPTLTLSAAVCITPGKRAQADIMIRHDVSIIPARLGVRSPPPRRRRRIPGMGTRHERNADVLAVLLSAVASSGVRCSCVRSRACACAWPCARCCHHRSQRWVERADAPIVIQPSKAQDEVVARHGHHTDRKAWFEVGMVNLVENREMKHSSTHLEFVIGYQSWKQSGSETHVNGRDHTIPR
jgi:hypothetical protein